MLAALLCALLPIASSAATPPPLVASTTQVIVHLNVPFRPEVESAGGSEAAVQR